MRPSQKPRLRPKRCTLRADGPSGARRAPPRLRGTLDMGFPYPVRLSVYSLGTDPERPERLFVGIDSYGLWESRDGGATFARTGLREGEIVAVLVGRADPDRLYAASDGQNGLYVSADGGATWIAGASPGARVVDLAQDPGAPGVLYAVVYGGARSSTRCTGASTAARPGSPPTATSRPHPASSA